MFLLTKTFDLIPLLIRSQFCRHNIVMYRCFRLSTLKVRILHNFIPLVLCVLLKVAYHLVHFLLVVESRKIVYAMSCNINH